MTVFQELSFFVYNHIKSLVFYINIHYHKHNYISDHNSDMDLYIFHCFSGTRTPSGSFCLR